MNIWPLGDTNEAPSRYLSNQESVSFYRVDFRLQNTFELYLHTNTSRLSANMNGRCSYMTTNIYFLTAATWVEISGMSNKKDFHYFHQHNEKPKF